MPTMYTAFLSSTYENLRSERQTAIDFLLDIDIMPFCMEHFTVSCDEQFEDIKKIIDRSDYFVLLLGKEYGSCDINGVSWTEQEYQYAVKKKIPILAIICEGLAENLKLSEEDTQKLPASEQKQIDFIKRSRRSFFRTVDKSLTIERILRQFFSDENNRSRCVGWTRPTNEDPKWCEENARYNLDDIWYHIHLSEKDKKYIRVGTIRITQDFTPDRYRLMDAEASNYNVLGVNTDGSIKIDDSKQTGFRATYTLGDKGELHGIYHAERRFTGKFDKKKVIQQTTRGIHHFTLPTTGANNERVMRIDGTFSDSAPARKHGQLYLFRSEKDRDNYLLERRQNYIGKKGILWTIRQLLNW